MQTTQTDTGRGCGTPRPCGYTAQGKDARTGRRVRGRGRLGPRPQSGRMTARPRPDPGAGGRVEGYSRADREAIGAFQRLLRDEVSSPLLSPCPHVPPPPRTHTAPLHSVRLACTARSLFASLVSSHPVPRTRARARSATQSGRGRYPPGPCPPPPSVSPRIRPRPSPSLPHPASPLHGFPPLLCPSPGPPLVCRALESARNARPLDPLGRPGFLRSLFWGRRSRGGGGGAAAEQGLACFVRVTRGDDESAACGQLATAGRRRPPATAAPAPAV
jgi:hypothetical protein